MFKAKAMKLKIAMNNGRLEDFMSMSTQFANRVPQSDPKVARRKGFQSSYFEPSDFPDVSGKNADQAVDIESINKQI